MSAFLDVPVTRLPHALGVSLLVASCFLLLAVTMPRLTLRAFHAIEKIFSRCAEQRNLAVVVLFFLVIGVRLSVLRELPVPVPGIHDEFSYLLMGDTFAHGRLTNPTHPMWMSFESFHINWFPTYSSKYPPGQGAVLALGQLLGHPWIGVLLSNAAMCAALLWMLQAWMPARWALLGAGLCALKFGVASYWMNSYWGGALAAAGGALVLGALPRIVRTGRARDALLLGLGVAVLAKTRPRAKAGNRVVRVLLPLAAILAVTAVFMGFYNWRLTGNAFLFPHVLNSRTYGTTGLFLWDHPGEPLEYHNQQFEDFYNGWEREDYQNSWSDVGNVSAEKLLRSGSTYFWWGVVLLLPGVPFVFFDRKMRLPLVIFVLGAVGFFALIWSFPHYVAPLTCVIFLLLVEAIRHLRTMRCGGRPLGLALSRAVFFLLAADVGFSVRRHECDPLAWTCQGDPSRAAIADKLSSTPGKHLVMVRYGNDHNIHDEWVYNGAEIDGAKVLWAREVEAGQNARLFAYFKDRQVWLVEPDEDNTELMPYPPVAARAEH